MFIGSLLLKRWILYQIFCIPVFPALGQYAEVYEDHLFLARFFTEPEDEWLKRHFSQLALHSARKFKMDCGKREAEANLHLGQVYLEKGNTSIYGSQVTFIYIALFTVQIVSKQLYSNNRKRMQQSLFWLYSRSRSSVVIHFLKNHVKIITC